MSHLNLEALARLVDEAPTALEAAHLAACAQCRDELQGLHEQSAQLAALPALQPPPEDWDRLEQRLQEEGLIRTPLAAYPPSRRRSWVVYGGRAAAAVALFAVGTLTGRALEPDRAPAVAATRTAPVIDATSPAPVRDATPAVFAPEDSGLGAAESAPPRRLTASAPAAPRAARTAEEAFDLLQQAESSYLEALGRFAELSGSTRTDDPTARLAALEGIVLTTRAALAQAPTDPVINGYHLTALAQRDATLRQVSAGATDRW
jgi:hypothetical protein